MSYQLSTPNRASWDALIGGFVDEQTFIEEVLLGTKHTGEAYQYTIERIQQELVLGWFMKTR